MRELVGIIPVITNGHFNYYMSLRDKIPYEAEMSAVF